MDFVSPFINFINAVSGAAIDTTAEVVFFVGVLFRALLETIFLGQTVSPFG